MKRVAIGELDLRSRNQATDQLTKNPAAERSRGSFVSASNGKGLRGVHLSVPERRELSQARVWRPVHRPALAGHETSQTLSPKTTIQLTTRSPSHPRKQPLHKLGL